MVDDPPASTVVSPCQHTGWPTRRPKLHVHEGITVEICCGAPEIAINHGGRRCADHETPAATIAELMGSLTPLAPVAVFLSEAWTPPSRIADAIWRADCLGDDRPHGVPADARLVDLPWSEVLATIFDDGLAPFIAQALTDRATDLKVGPDRSSVIGTPDTVYLAEEQVGEYRTVERPVYC